MCFEILWYLNKSSPDQSKINFFEPEIFFFKIFILIEKPCFKNYRNGAYEQAFNTVVANVQLVDHTWPANTFKILLTLKAINF